MGADLVVGVLLEVPHGAVQLRLPGEVALAPHHRHRQHQHQPPPAHTHISIGGNMEMKNTVTIKHFGYVDNDV